MSLLPLYLCCCLIPDPEEGEESEESEEEDEVDEALPVAGDPNERNSQLTVGHKNDRTFVVRGDKIGVFKHTDEGKVEYAATIRDLGFKKMKSIKPKHVCLCFAGSYTSCSSLLNR